uniref:Kazal-like domain-containing protein n=1 Tax=Glossina morsitans morsitans TaxID=37546 RepID=A0A1B0FLX8_GLOMM
SRRPREALTVVEDALEEFSDNLNLLQIKAHLQVHLQDAEIALVTVQRMLAIWRELYVGQVTIEDEKQSDTKNDQVTCDDGSCNPKQVCLKDLLTHKPRCSPCRSKRHSTTHHRFEASKISGVNSRTYNSWCEMRKDSCATGFYIDLKHAGECL